MQFGFRRAPLELIAHVVENDRPYTEILTADYIMANPFAAKSLWGIDDIQLTPRIRASSDRLKITKYYRKGEGSMRANDDPDVMVKRSASSTQASLSTRFTRTAGILNTKVVPVPLPDDGDQPQPGAGALDLLSLPRRGHRELRLEDHGPRRTRGHQQPDHA